MPDIKEQKLLYHLTSLCNLTSILQHGLQPRSQIRGFTDVADPEIIQKRSAFGLDKHVPFHWFSRNPFDGGVQRSRAGESFVLITVQRALARAQNWKVIPRHPLANEAPELMDYAQGFESIDWDAMNRRDYHEAYSKSVCMAECLCPTAVPANWFFAVYVQNQDIEHEAQRVACALQPPLNIKVNPHMFL